MTKVQEVRCTVTVRPAPKDFNEFKGRHWGCYAKERKRIGDEVGWQLKNQRNIWPRPPIRVEVIRCAQKEMDPGGVIESLKAVVDSMVDVGLIPDDTAEHVRYGDPVHITITPGEVSELVVTLVNDEERARTGERRKER